MKKEEKLKKIIEYAVKNGGLPKGTLESFDQYTDSDWEKDIFLNRHYGLLFLHPFAEAVFGKKDACCACGNTVLKSKRVTNIDSSEVEYIPYCNRCSFEFIEDEPYFTRIPSWQYHLQQAVISKSLIEYYFNFIE